MQPKEEESQHNRDIATSLFSKLNACKVEAFCAKMMHKVKIVRLNVLSGTLGASRSLIKMDSSIPSSHASSGMRKVSIAFTLTPLQHHVNSLSLLRVRVKSHEQWKPVRERWYKDGTDQNQTGRD
jgi:hypothetical protein